MSESEHKPVDKKVLDGFIAEHDRLKERKDVASTAIAQLYKEHKNTFGVHTQALKLAIKLRGMEPDTRDDFLRAFDEYRDTLDLDAQLDLFEDGAANDNQADDASAAPGLH